jgi:hypothetical protein
MNQPPSLTRPHTDRHDSSHHHRLTTTLIGLAGLLTLAIGLAPVASATYLPPNPAAHPVVPPPLASTMPAHLPGWAIAAMVAGTMVLSIVTTLATLSLFRWRDQRQPAADADQVAEPFTAPSPEDQPGQDDILVSQFRHSG